MADYLSEVGTRLLTLRKANRLSQEDAAHRVGVAVKTWRNWEGGLRAPYERNWEKIAQAFELDDEAIAAIRGTPPVPLGLGPGSDPVVAQLDRIERELKAVRLLLERLLPEDTLFDVLDDLEQDPAHHQQQQAGGGGRPQRAA